MTNPTEHARATMQMAFDLFADDGLSEGRIMGDWFWNVLLNRCEEKQ